MGEAVAAIISALIQVVINLVAWVARRFRPKVTSPLKVDFYPAPTYAGALGIFEAVPTEQLPTVVSESIVKQSLLHDAVTYLCPTTFLIGFRNTSSTQDPRRILIREVTVDIKKYRYCPIVFEVCHSYKLLLLKQEAEKVKATSQ